MDPITLILLFFLYKFCAGIVWLFQNAEEIRDSGFKQMAEEQAEAEADGAAGPRVGDPTGKPRLHIVKSEAPVAFSLDDDNDTDSDPFGLED